MAYEDKKNYDIIRILTLLLIALPFAASTNINCDGKSFHCVNSTHFMICVDLGSGVSSTMDEFVIPCPPTTECQATNRFECEFPSTTATNVKTSVSSAAEYLETTVSDSSITISPYQVSDPQILDNNIESTTWLQNNANKNIPVTLYAEILTTESTKIAKDITLQPPLQRQDVTNNNKLTDSFDLSKEFNVTSKKNTNQEAMTTKTDSRVPFVTLSEERVVLDPSLNINLLENSVKGMELTADTTYDTTETQISTHKYEVTTESAIITALTAKEHNIMGHINTNVTKDSLLINMSLVNDTKQDELMTNTKVNLKINVTNFEVIEPRLYHELSTENSIATTSKAIEGIGMEVMRSTTSLNIFTDDKTLSTISTDTDKRPSTPSNYNPSETTTSINVFKEDKTFSTQSADTENILLTISHYYPSETTTPVNIFKDDTTFSSSTGTENRPSMSSNYTPSEITTSVNIFKDDTTFSTISAGTENRPSTPSNYNLSETFTAVNIVEKNKTFSTISTGTESGASTPSNYNMSETSTAVNLFKDDTTFSTISTGTESGPSTPSNYNLSETSTAVNLFKDNKTSSTISTGTKNGPSTPSNYNPSETTTSVNIFKDNTIFSTISTGTENRPSTPSNYNSSETTTSVNIFQDNKTSSTISTGTKNGPSTPSNYNPSETTTSVNIFKDDTTISTISTGTESGPLTPSNYNLSETSTAVNLFKDDTIFSTISTGTENRPSTPSNYNSSETTTSVNIFQDNKTSSTISTGTKNGPSTPSNYNPSETTTPVNIFKEDKTFITLSTGKEISPSTPSNYNPSETEVYMNNITLSKPSSEKESKTTAVQNNEIVSVNHITLDNFVTTEKTLKSEETDHIAFTTIDLMENTQLENKYISTTADVTFFDEVDQYKFSASLSNTEVNRPMTTEPIINHEVTEISTVNSLQANNISGGIEMVEAVTSNSVKTTFYTEVAPEGVVTTQQNLQNQATKEKVARTTLNVKSTNKTEEIMTTRTTYSIPMEQDVLRTSTVSNYESDKTLPTMTVPSLKIEVTTDTSNASTLQLNNNVDGEELIEAVTSISFNTAKPDTRFTTESFMVQQILENAETTEKLGKVTLNMEVSNIIEDVGDLVKHDTMLSITNVMEGSTSTILPNIETKIKVENYKVTVEKNASDKNETGRNVDVIDFIPSENKSTQPLNYFTTEKISSIFSRLENATTIESLSTPTINLIDSNYMDNIIHFTAVDDRHIDDSMLNMVNVIGEDGMTNVSKPNAELEVTTNATFLNWNLKDESTSETNISAFSLKKTYINGSKEMSQLQNLEDVTVFEDFIRADSLSTQNLPENGVSTTELTLIKTEQGKNKVYEPLVSDYISTTETILSTSNEATQHITTVVENMQLASNTISEKVKAPEKNINNLTAIVNTNKNNDCEVIPNITSTSNNVTIHMALAVLNTTTHDEIKMFNNSNILPHIIKESSPHITTESLTTKSTSAYYIDDSNNSTTELNKDIVYDTRKDKLKTYNGSNNTSDKLTVTERRFMPRNITTPGINDTTKITLTKSSTISSIAELIPTLTIHDLNLNTKINMDYNTHDHAITEPITFDTHTTTESFLQEGTLKYAVAWNKKLEMDILFPKKNSKSADSTRDEIVNGLTQTNTQETISSDISNRLNRNLFDIIRIGMVTTKPSKQLIIDQSTRSDFVTQPPDLNKLETAAMLSGTEEFLMKIEKDRNIYIEKLASNQNLKTTTNKMTTPLLKNINKEQSLNIPIVTTEVMGTRDEKNQTQNLKDITKSFNIIKQESFENKYLINNNSDSNVTTIFKENQASPQNTSDLNTEHYKVISNGTNFQEKDDLNSRVKSQMDIIEINKEHQSMIPNDEIKDRQNQSNSIIRDIYVKNVSTVTVFQEQGPLESFQNDKILIVEKDPNYSKNVTYITLNNKVFKPSASETVKVESEQNVNSQLDEIIAISKKSDVMQGNVTLLNNFKTPKAEKINLNINNLEIASTQTNTKSISNDLKEFNNTKLGIHVNIYERDTSVSIQQNNKVENDSMSIIKSLIKNEAGNSGFSPKSETSFQSTQKSAESNNKLRTGSEKEINHTQAYESISVTSTRDLTSQSEDLTTLSDNFLPNLPVSNDTQTSLTKTFEKGTLQALEITPSPENLSTVKSEKEKAYLSEVAKLQLETAITSSQLVDKDSLVINGSSVDIMKNGNMKVEYDLKNVTGGTPQLQLKLDLNKPQKMQNEDKLHNMSSMPWKKIPLETQNTIEIKGINNFNNENNTSATTEIIQTIPKLKDHKDQIHKIKNETPIKNIEEQIQVDKEFINVLGTSDQKSTSMTNFSLYSFDGPPTLVTLQNHIIKTDKIEIVTEVAEPISSDLLTLYESPTTKKMQDIIVPLSKNVSGSNQNIDESRKPLATYDPFTGGLIEKTVPEYAEINEKNKMVNTKNQTNVVSTTEAVNKNNAERNKEIHLTKKYTEKLIVPSAITTTIGLSTNIEIKKNVSKIIPNVINKSNTKTLITQNNNPLVYGKSDTNEQSQVASTSYSEDTLTETDVKHNTNNETKQKEEEVSLTSQNKSEGHNKQSQENNNLENSVKIYCRLKNRGKYSDREDCQKFYICIGRDEPIIGRCPQNTVFSDVRKQCTKNLSHCTRQSEFRCIAQGRFSDILEDNIYYICVTNGNNFIRFKFQCHKGYFLNKTSVKCYRKSESESNVQTSRKSSEYSSKSERSERKEEGVKDKSKEKHKRNDENKSVHFDCESEGKFAHPNDCRKYYVCTTNKKSEFRRKRKKCDSDEVFHKEKKECVDADSYEC